MPFVAGCSSDDGKSTSGGGSNTGDNKAPTGSSSSSSSSSLTCSINGACYECPSEAALEACAKDGPSGSGCTSADSSKCSK
jgi:hypothetical protein